MGVSFSKSPRGRPAETLETTAANPLKFKARIWLTPSCATDPGGGLPGRMRIAETLICFVSRVRVSLLGCSGAILDRGGPGGAGCVCCLRTQ